jgi:RNA recognition motif-containing protein
MIRSVYPQYPTFPAEEDTTLFIGDLSVFCDEQLLEELFLPFGPAIYITLVRCEYTQRSLGYGFVKYVHWLSAKRAIEALQGQIVIGRALR